MTTEDQAVQNASSCAEKPPNERFMQHVKPLTSLDSAPRLPSCWITSHRAVIGQMPPRHLLDHYVSLSVPKYNDSYLEKTRAVPYSAGFIITVEGYIRASMSHLSLGLPSLSE